MEIVNNKNGHTVSSREIASYAGKNHSDVMRAIRKMEKSWMEVSESNFALAEYTDEQGKKRPEYLLTKKESLYIATKFNDVARAKLINRWEELEKQVQNNQFQIPTTLSGALLLASQQAEQIEQQQLLLEQTNKQLNEVSTKVNEQANQLKEQAHKVVFADAVKESADSILIGHLATLITQAGFEIGQNRLFQLLRDLGYLGCVGEKKNKPLQHAVEDGLFELKYSEYLDNQGKRKMTTVTKVTAKGQEFFINLFKI
ncbi:phage regulatory protein/antirepressor Ant [Sphingobacterium multivorum]|uniref:phage regulatory protein/antirepressor Ant n=1 Tax=Sphingobacterium multivorum TaxID=28454 RepID=UPI0028AC7949|nr:phage regulatory protein/antirepressor Ant [Sphingobacterium multivorum]